MRKINVNKIRHVISDLSIEANIRLRRDIEKGIKNALKKETHTTTKRIFSILLENAEIARKEKRAICQDTGIVSVYIEIGQDVRLVGGSLIKAINNGVKEGYKKGGFRQSVVKSPIIRENTGTNTPVLIYTEIREGKRVRLTVAPKGFGSENKSSIKMLRPTDDEKQLIKFVIDVTKDAGPDACPPYILGIGIGGTFDKAAALAKKALLLPIDKKNPKRHLRTLEHKILKVVNKLGIGPLGFGAKTTCLGINILECPTHIAGLPVAVNVGCHVTRSASKVI